MADKERFSLDKFFEPIEGIHHDPTNVEPRVKVYDVIDGKYVVGITAEYRVGEELVKSLDSTNFDGVLLELTQGRGVIERDPYTGRYLVTPKGDIPLRARAVSETMLNNSSVLLSGSDHDIGIDTNLLPLDEKRVEVAGGSGCTARWEVYAQRDFQVQVRAGLSANVIPKSMSEREISWKHAMYFAQDEQIGFMRLSYNPEQESKLQMQSKEIITRENSNAFFPARGKNQLFFKVEFRDMGYTAFNKKPMTQTIDDVTWPPYRVPILEIDEPVEFYDVDNPDVLVMTLLNQTMRLYDYSSLEVENIQFEVGDNGLLQSRWRISNQSEDIIVARWFVLGDFLPIRGQNAQANRMLGPAGSGNEHYEFTFNAQISKSSLTQFISMNVTSMGQPILSGIKRVDFRFPTEE